MSDTISSIQKNKIPHMYWSQDKEDVYLKIDIKANPMNVTLTSTGLHFNATSQDSSYQLDLHWNQPVIEEYCSYQWMSNYVQFLLKKNTKEEWNHLLNEEDHKKYKSWLKTDWNNWSSEDIEDDYQDVNFGFDKDLLHSEDDIDEYESSDEDEDENEDNEIREGDETIPDLTQNNVSTLNEKQIEELANELMENI